MRFWRECAENRFAGCVDARRKNQHAVKIMLSRLSESLLIAAVATTAVAAAELKSVSLDECLRQAIEKNLSLRISRYDPELAQINLHSAYSGYDPTFNSSVGQSFSTIPRPASTNLGAFTPQAGETWQDHYTMGLNGLGPYGFQYGLNGNLARNNSKQFGFDPNGNPLTTVSSGYGDSASLSLRQPVLKNFLIDSTRLNIALAKESLKQSVEGVRDQILSLARNVAVAYYGLIATKDSIRVQESALELAERSLAENKKRVEVGAMAPLEEKQAEAQVAARRADLILARQNYDRAVNGLKRLVSDDFGSLDGTGYVPTAVLEAIPEAFSRQDSWHKALSQRPAIISQKLDLAKRNISLRFAKNQLYPELDLTGSFGLAGNQRAVGAVLGDLSDRRNPNFSFGIELSMPLTRRAAKDRLKTERVGIEASLLTYKDLEQSIMREVDDYILVAQSSLERVSATKAAQSFAEAALDAEQKKLENGKSTSFQVLSLQRDLVNAQKDTIGALTDYNIALINLSWSEGSLLEKLKVNVTVR